MGDRSQIAVKQPTKKDKCAKVYLYGHWIGDGIYTVLQKVFTAGARLDDEEYLTRIIAREMGMGEDGETGFGIGTGIHGDVEHLVPVLDCTTKMVSFEQPEWDHNKTTPLPKPLSFAEFAKPSSKPFRLCVTFRPFRHTSPTRL